MGCYQDVYHPPTGAGFRNHRNPDFLEIRDTRFKVQGAKNKLRYSCAIGIPHFHTAAGTNPTC